MRDGRKGGGQGDRDGPHLHEQDFGTSIRGTGGSPAPDKGHDRLAAFTGLVMQKKIPPSCLHSATKASDDVGKRGPRADVRAVRGVRTAGAGSAEGS